MAVDVRLQVPNSIAQGISSRTRDMWLKRLLEYRQDQEDIDLVKDEMMKHQTGVSLQDYITKWSK